MRSSFTRSIVYKPELFENIKWRTYYGKTCNSRENVLFNSYEWIFEFISPSYLYTILQIIDFIFLLPPLINKNDLSQMTNT